MSEYRCESLIAPADLFSRNAPGRRLEVETDLVHRGQHRADLEASCPARGEPGLSRSTPSLNARRAARPVGKTPPTA